MGKAILAEKTDKHYAIKTNPLWLAIACLSRSVPVGGGVKFDMAENVSTKTQAHGNPLFINCSVAIDPPAKFTVFTPEHDPKHPVDHGFACYHGHMGLVERPHAIPVTAAINCGQTKKDDTHCTAELLDKLGQFFKKLWNSDDSSELQLTKFGGGLVVGVAQGAWEMGKGAFDIGYGIGTHLGKAYDRGAQGMNPILAGMDPVGTIARGEVAMAKDLKKKFDDATKGMSTDEINATIDEWLVQTLVKGGCAAAKALGEALNDPKNSAPYNGGKTLGKIAFDVVTAVETVGAGLEAKAGAGAAKSEGLIDSLMEKLRKSKEPKSAEPVTTPHGEAPKTPVTEEPHSGSTPGEEKPLKPCPHGCPPGVGGPVNPVLGVKVLAGEEDLDFILPGIFPLAWQRTYCSSNPQVGWLGQGWGMAFETHLKIQVHGVELIDPSGRAIPFLHLAPGRTRYQSQEQLTLARSEDGHTYMLTTDGGTLSTFAIAERPGMYRLVRIQDRDGNAITFDYDGAYPYRITGSGGQVLDLTFKHHRLHKVTEYISKHHTKVWIEYRHNENGDLIGVLDARGHYRRRFAWKNHLMTAHWNAAGFETRYVYDQYTTDGKVIAHSNSLGGDWRFEYLPGETIVTDALKRTSRYRYDAQQRWTGLVHPDGSQMRRELDPFGHLLWHSDELGRKTRYVRDERGNPIHVQYPDGSSTGIVWDNHWQQPAQIIHADGSSERFLFDERGRVITHIGRDDGIARTEYNAQGLPVRITDPRGGVVALEWDRLGNLTSYTDCSGKTTRHTYQEELRTETIDALGQTTRYHYNASRQLSAIHHPDGKMEQYQYDAIGRLRAYTDAQGQVSRYDLDTDGLPKSRTDTLGHTLRYEYDAARRLTTLFNENNRPYGFTYDSNDRLLEESGFDGLATRYRYNRASELIERIEGANTATPVVTAYRRDTMGRLIEKYSQGRRPDGSRDRNNRSRTRFAYNTAGQMTEARNRHGKVELQYDDAGRVIEETTTAFGRRNTLRHAWSVLGHRTQTTLPDGRVLNYLSYGSGHVHQINIDGEVISDFERDDLHREISRTQGVLASDFRYDPMGRLADQRVRHQQQSMGSIDPQAGAKGLGQLHGLPGWDRPSLAGLTRRYQYDNVGQLLQLDDSRRGARGYRYDLAGQLRIAQQPGLRETFDFDPAHNLLDQQQPQANDNRLTAHGELSNAYDPLGRLVSKTTKEQTLQLRWDNEGQLSQSVSTRHGKGHRASVTCYAYDPFGRRLAKWNKCKRRDGDTKRILYGWDGNRLLEEDDGVTRRTYIYRPGGFEPLAQVTRRSGALPAVPVEERDPQEAFDEQLRILLSDRTQPEEARQALRDALSEQAILEKYGVAGIVLTAAQQQQKVQPAQEEDAAQAGQQAPAADYRLGQDPREWAALRPAAKTIQIAGIEFQAVTPEPEPTPAKIVIEKAPIRTADYRISDDPLDWEPLRLPHVIELQGVLPTPPRSANDIEIYYYHTDHLGTPQEVTNEAGEIVWEGKYKAWGGLIGEQDEPTETSTMTAAQLQAWERQQRRQPQFHQPMRFQGQYHDLETGLHYNRFRYYDPDVGRFISQDPIGLFGGENLYRYNPNPINWIDPFGLAPCSPRINLKHIFHGETNRRGRPTGFHHQGSIGHGDSAIITQRGPSNAQGVYQANVGVLNPATGIYQTKTSTMFPDAWSRAKTLDEIRSAYQDALNKGAVNGSKFKGISCGGVEIEGYLDSAGNINTAFPKM